MKRVLLTFFIMLVNNQVSAVSSPSFFSNSYDGFDYTYKVPAKWLDDDSKQYIISEVKKLISQGANVNEKGGRFGKSPLHYAISAEEVKMLVAAGADVNATDSRGNTPLHCAYANAQKTQALLDAGANPNIVNNTGDSPVWCHYSYGELEDQAWEEGDPSHKVIEILIKGGLDPNIGKSPKAGWGFDDKRTPIFFVDPDNVQLLIDNGANIYTKDIDGNSPLHKQGAKSIEILIKAGLDPNIKNNAGETPLHINMSKTILQTLIRLGANINAQDNAGETPLHKALKRYKDENTDKDSKKIYASHIKALLDAKADITLKNNNGESFLSAVLSYLISEKLCGNDTSELSFINFKLNDIKQLL